MLQINLETFYLSTFQESMIDAVTGISGSGPAYMYLIIGKLFYRCRMHHMTQDGRSTPKTPKQFTELRFFEWLPCRWHSFVIAFCVIQLKLPRENQVFTLKLAKVHYYYASFPIPYYNFFKDGLDLCLIMFGMCSMAEAIMFK